MAIFQEPTGIASSREGVDEVYFSIVFVSIGPEEAGPWNLQKKR